MSAEGGMRWAIITGEYPPQPGGVSDYTGILAKALAEAGDEVHVWAPACAGQEDKESAAVLHRLHRGFGPGGLRRMGKELNELPKPYRILVQYVPHAFGWKAMNVPFCLWLWLRRRTPVWVMFHEVAFPLGRSQPLRHNVLGVVTRLMAALVVRSAERIFLSTPAWEPLVRPLGRKGRLLTWLPVPSNVGTNCDCKVVQSLREQVVGPGGCLIGHFGTFADYFRKKLTIILPRLLGSDERRRVLLLGRGSESFRLQLVQSDSSLCDRVTAFDGLPGEQLGAWLAACDLVIQPYPDGISTRRGSAMGALGAGTPIVTNEGPLSEPLWRESGAVYLTADASPGAFIAAAEDLLRSPDKKTELLRRSNALYRERFAIERTVATLRSTA